MDYSQIITKYALENAVKYGKADANRITGGVFGELFKKDPSLKGRVPEIRKEMQKIVDEINSLSPKEQEDMLREIKPDFFEKKEIKDELKELNNVGDKVVMRFAPSPSGPMHIGHAFTGGITSLYVDKYKGKFVLRIEDTNPENIYEPAYELLPKDAEWIFGNVSEVWVQSDRMDYYYDYLHKFFELGKAYVCTCDADKFREYSLKQEECPCRNLSKEEVLGRWKLMLEKYEPGQAVVRFKSDMKHKNPAMRDFPLARINDHEHPRQGTRYRVWPLMNLSVTVDDIEAGMTHIIRAKDHMDNAKRQKLMYEVLGEKYPEVYFTGRYNFEGLELSSTKTKAKIERGEFGGWEDIRLPFLGALRRRGYQPEAFKKLAKMNGLSQNDKSVTAEEFFKLLNSFNSEIIEKSNRYFFVNDPVEIQLDVVDGLYKECTIPLHPEDKNRGFRVLKIQDKIYITKEDLLSLEEGYVHRLMDAYNVKLVAGKFIFESETFEEYKNAQNKGKIIHWLPVDNVVEMKVRMPNNSFVTGFAEAGVKDLKEGDIVQFERFAFCRLDNKKEMEFWFTHK